MFLLIQIMYLMQYLIGYFHKVHSKLQLGNTCTHILIKSAFILQNVCVILYTVLKFKEQAQLE